MNRHKVLAIFFGCLAIGALNEAVTIFRTNSGEESWQPKSIAAVAVGIFAAFTAYFWRKANRVKR